MIRIHLLIAVLVLMSCLFLLITRTDMETKKQEMIDRLPQDLMGWEGFRRLPHEERQEFGLGAIESAFLDKIFATGALNEFISTRPEFTAAIDSLL
jgi:protein ImuA